MKKRAIYAFICVCPRLVAVPLWFEPNQGQAHPSVQFVARDAYLGPTSLAIHVDTKSVVMSLIGARGIHGEGLDPQPGITSYFLGNDPKKWHAGIPHYARVQYRNIYPGIDVIYYHNSANQLEYDFVISPGADPERIEMAWNQPIREDKNGDLLIAGVHQKRPKIYQGAHEIAAHYLVHAGNRIQLSLAAFDHSQALTVDPVLQYSTYLGGPALEWGSGIQIDSAGSAYITGSARSPATPSVNPFQQVSSLSEDAYVLKLTPSGNAVAFFVVLGGVGDDYSEGIALDGMNNAWIAGMTRSLDFPAKNAAQPIYGGGFDDAFYAKVRADGRSIIFSSYAGGMSDDWARGVAINPDGSAWVAGYTASLDFSVKNAYQSALAGSLDAFLMRISSDGKVSLATYLGGSGSTAGTGVASDNQGNGYLIGHTYSSDFPLKSPLQPKFNASSGGGFLSKFSCAGALLYSTFLCGNAGCLPTRVAADTQGSAYILGQTGDGFPVNNAAQSAYGGGADDKFVMKVTPDGQTVVYATYLGGSNNEYGYGGLALDSSGNLYVGGHSSSPDFPTKNPVQPFRAGGTPSSGNATITALAPGGGLIFSSSFGGSGNDWAEGIALDISGDIYITGSTTSADFPTKDAIQATYGGGGGDILVAKFAPDTRPASPFSASPIALPFRYVTGGPVPTPQTITVASTPPGLTFTPSATVPWVKVTSSSQTTPATLSVSVDPAGLIPGQYSAKIQIDAQTSVQVNLTVFAPAPTLVGIAPQSVPVDADTTVVTVTGSGFQQTTVVQVNGVAFQTTFVDSGTLQFTLDKSSLKQAATLAITVMNPQSVSSTPLTFSVGTPSPQFSAASVTNAASFTAGPVAPGEIISVFGTNLTNAVTFDGTPATLVFYSPTQLNVTVPYSVAGPTTVLQIGASSTQLQLAPSAPGIFAAELAGDGIVVLYATGCGPLTTDDLPRCALPVSVSVNDQPATVLYAGIAPGLLQGANQINIQVPDGITSGQLTIVLSAGDASSKPFVWSQP